MVTEFKPATRTQNRLRLVIDGAAGSGKAYTALRLAHDLGRRVFVIDTQYGSAPGTTGSGWGYRPLPKTRSSSRFAPGSNA